MDNLDFLDGQEPDDTAAPEAQEAPEVQAEPEGQPRAPDGKFAPKEAKAEEPPKAEPEAEAKAEPELTVPKEEPKAPEQPAPEIKPEPQTPPPGYVPINVVQELRNEIKALKNPPAPPPTPPNAYEDPEGYAAFQQQQVYQLALNNKLDMSEEMARSKHGEELVNAAQQWALQKMDQSPSFQAEVLSQRHPYEFAVQAYQREQIVSQLKPADLEAFRAWQAAQAAQQANGAPPVAQAAPAQQPPRSQAAAPSAGSTKPGEMPLGEQAVFGSVFK